MHEQLNGRRRKTAEMGMKVRDNFELMSQNPMAVQTKLLMELLQDNKDTEYGKMRERGHTRKRLHLVYL